MQGNSGHILLLSGVRGDTRRYRTFHPYEQLQLAGASSALSHITDPELFAKAEGAGVIILHRTGFDSCVERLLRQADRQGSLVILDSDDLIFDPAAFQWIDSPDFHDPVRAALYQEEMRRHRATLQACHAVTVSTAYLAQAVRSFEKPVWVHRNAFSLEMLALAESAYQNRVSDHSRVVIGYASGTPTHDRDFASIKPALEHILRQYPQTELWIIGPLDPGKDWGSLSARIMQHKFVPWRELPGLLVKLDINIAPLVMDNPFAQSKSEIKYVEAGLVRVPTVASPTDAYRFAVRDHENGFTAANTQEWIDALAELVEDAGLRRMIGERAYEHVQENYHPMLRAQELVVTLNQIASELRGEAFWQSLSSTEKRRYAQPDVFTGMQILHTHKLEKSPSLSRMALYSLKYRGIRTLIGQLWIYFRRWLAPIFPFRPTKG